MGSATRGALASSTAVLAGAKHVTLTTGEQLLAASRAIAGSAQLRGLLADPAVTADDKARIVSKVFGELDAAAGEVLASAVTERWSSHDDLVAGVEELGIRAVAESGKESRIEAELFEFGRAVSSDPALELAVSAKLGDPAGKVSLVDSLLGKDASKATLAIVRHLVQSPRGRRIGALLATASDIVADAGDRLVATVTASVPLSEAQQRRLTTALAAQYGRAPQLNVVLDPTLIGGLRVQVADDVIDGSIASRLHDLRIQLAG